MFNSSCRRTFRFGATVKIQKPNTKSDDYERFNYSTKRIKLQWLRRPKLCSTNWCEGTDFEPMIYGLLFSNLETCAHIYLLLKLNNYNVTLWIGFCTSFMEHIKLFIAKFFLVSRLRQLALHIYTFTSYSEKWIIQYHDIWRKLFFRSAGDYKSPKKVLLSFEILLKVVAY